MFTGLVLVMILAVPRAVFGYVSPGQPTGFVNDFAGVLSVQSKQELEAFLADYEAQTTHEITVATIPRLLDETIETYAVRLFEDWKVGKAGKDNGALFVIAVDDRKMRIETGYGIEPMLTDVEAKQIVTNVVPPYFRSNDYDEGVRAGVVAIIQGIGADYTPSAAVSRDPAARGDNSGAHILDFFWIFIFVFIWMGSVFARSRSWWAGGVLGGVIGLIVWLVSGGWWWLPILIVFGLLFDYLVSTKYKKTFTKGYEHSGVWPWLFLMGGRPGRRWDKGGGGFGGFGGGLSGGGGASGRW